ncbi:MAG: ATP-dependent helicase [Thermodesulfobacteriota bacterium]|nr:ATP-dependent helicase [Thermodesulfobacteriota bacterium]
MTLKLSTQQEAAVTHMGTPALVTAGAGSGKTRTLTAKIAHLIKQGYTPDRILAITFTNKAADEMKHRLVEMTGIPETGFPWVRTYHSACFKILNAHCTLLGYETPLQIYDVYHQRKTIKDILIHMNVDKKNVPAVLGEISRAKNSGAPMAYFDQRPFAGYVKIAEVYTLYEKELKAKNAVDFDNILLLVRDILRQYNDVRQKYQKRFQYILVDEYQDTNNLQEELTTLLCSGNNLFCVGDDWQAIYSFRGSNINHFLTFERRYADARVFRLEQNFRSADEIVKLANCIIENNDDKMDKTCFSEKKGGVVDPREFDDEVEEAAWVADKARDIHENEGVPYNQMAVLYRTKFTSLYFEHRFREAGIPYQLLGDKGFFDRKEIMDINSYILAAVFPKDDAAFERIVNIPRRGIGPKTLMNISRLRTGDMSVQEAARQALSEKLLSGKVYNGLRKLMDLLDEIRSMPPVDAMTRVIDGVGYLDYLQQYANSSSMDFTEKQENIEQLVYAASRKETLVEYLEEAALVREDKEEEGGNGINLSTIHAAKGLEFHTVFVAGCEENLFPHWKSLETPEEVAEERRLMYVAMTRAEKNLYLTSTDFRKGQFNRRSRFLYELDRALTD